MYSLDIIYFLFMLKANVLHPIFDYGNITYMFIHENSPKVQVNNPVHCYTSLLSVFLRYTLLCNAELSILDQV